MIILQVQDYLDLIREQILSQLKILQRKPTRSLSAGSNKLQRDLVPFKSNQNAYIQLYNLILDNYLRVRSAYQQMDEMWLYILEICYPA